MFTGGGRRVGRGQDEGFPRHWRTHSVERSWCSHSDRAPRMALGPEVSSKCQTPAGSGKDLWGWPSTQCHGECGL